MSRKVPVLLEPTKDRRIVVFGGGNVALRKCRQFEGFHITVIADRTVPGMQDVSDEIILEHFDPEDIGKYIDGAFMVIAATDSKNLNSQITRCVKERHVLINSAHGGGDIILPSVVRKENYTVAVSSEGSVPAFPPYVAKQIDSFLGPEYDRMMMLLTDVRKGLQDRISEQPKRAEYLAEILSMRDIWNMLRDNDMAGAFAQAASLEKKYH